MSRPLNEDMKIKISELYHSSNLSYGAIAEKLGISKRSVIRYKDFSNKQQSESVNFLRKEQFNDDIRESEFEQEENNILCCPECGASRSEWIAIGEALDLGYDIPEGYGEDDFDFVCSNCDELIKT